jgi:hypothetical protein
MSELELEQRMNIKFLFKYTEFTLTEDLDMSGSGSRKSRLTAMGIHYADHASTADKWLSPSQCSSLVD